MREIEAIPKQSQKILELIIALLVVLIPFLSTNLTYDPTVIKIAAIKTGLLLILVIYALKSLADKKFRIKKLPSLFPLFLLAAYLVFGSIAVPPVPAEDLFMTFLFFGFFLPWRIYPLTLNLSGY